VKTIKTAHWGFTATLLWGILIAIVFTLIQVATALYMASQLDDARQRAFLLAADQNGQLLSLATFITTLLCSLLIMGIIKLKKGAGVKEYLALRGVPLQTALKWFGLLAGLIILSDAAMALLGRPIVPEFMTKTYETVDPAWMFWLALIIAAPLFEELFFRGFLMRGLQHSFLTPAGAVVATTALWAILHHQYDWYGIAVVFILGLMLGAARIKTGSLLLPLAMHAFVNAVATIQVVVVTSH